MAATFYGTLLDAGTYFTDRGNTTWAAATEAARTAALVRASMAIDGRYEARFPGTRAGGYSQALAWPRTGATMADGSAIPSSAVPLPVTYAAYEAALYELTTPGGLSPVVTAGKVKKRTKVGSIEVEYATGSSTAELFEGAMPVLTVIDGLLWPFLTFKMPGIMVV